MPDIAELPRVAPFRSPTRRRTMVSMDSADVMQLTSQLQGSVRAPTDEGYDADRRVWNATIDRHPALIARCTCVDDVVAAIAFARTQGLGVSVRSAGHHVAGSAVLDGGLVIDVSAMNTVTVDPATRTVRAEGGARLGDVDRATQRHGLAVPLGLVSDTGVAGLTLGGGYGWMRRKHGLSCDNVVAVELVTAAGQQVRATAVEHPDLFWALQGGGWDLGVVTAFEYRAHPVGPEVYCTHVIFPLAEGVRVLTGLRDFGRSMPPDAGLIGTCGFDPDTGLPFVGVTGPYLGDVADGERLYAPLRDLGPVVADRSCVRSWRDLQRVRDEDYPPGRRYYWKSSHIRHLDADVADILVDWFGRAPSPLATVNVWLNGGAMAEVGPSASPMGNRAAPFMIGIEANWEDPGQDTANITWARGMVAAFEPHSSGGAYLNFDDLHNTEAQMRAVGVNVARLVEVKQAYDPTNLFRSRRPMHLR